MALSAAPLRRLSPERNRARPRPSGAVASWREDTSPGIAAALAGEWAIFLEMTDGLDVDARARLLEESFGGAWSPQSDEELHVLTRALKPEA